MWTLLVAPLHPIQSDLARLLKRLECVLPDTLFFETAKEPFKGYPTALVTELLRNGTGFKGEAVVVYGSLLLGLLISGIADVWLGVGVPKGYSACQQSSGWCFRQDRRQYFPVPVTFRVQK